MLSFATVDYVYGVSRPLTQMAGRIAIVGIPLVRRTACTRCSMVDIGWLMLLNIGLVGPKIMCCMFRCVVVLVMRCVTVLCMFG